MKNAVSKSGIPLTNLDLWFEHAGPKSAHQWKDGRSAKECARSWIQAGGIPPGIRALLEGGDAFGPITRWAAEPEARVRFDRLRGEPSNLDVLLLVEDVRGGVVVAIEAKADEPFGATVQETLAAADRRLAENPRSKGRLRVEQLFESILGAPLPALALQMTSLRYQLFTATAAAIAEAERRELDRAVVLIHEFVTDQTDDERHRANAVDLTAFLAAIGIAGDPGDGLPGGGVLGGAPLFSDSVRVWFGKMREVLR